MSSVGTKPNASDEDLASASRRADVSAGTHGTVQLVDRLPDLLDGRVDVVDGVVDPWLDRGMRRQPAGGLQGQTGGEETLDDVVVHVAGDPVPIVQQRHEGPVRLRPPGEQSQPGLLGEVGQRRHRLAGQPFGLLVPGDDENAAVPVARG